MSGQIRITPAELMSQAKAYSQGANEVQTVLRNLESTTNQIASEWEGAAFRQYQAQFEQLKPKVRQFAELLQTINGQLNTAAKTLDDTDRQISKQFGFK